MQNLNLYFVLFSYHDQEKKEWSAHAGYIFEESEEDVRKSLEKAYGLILMQSIVQVDIQKGTILYGERWHQIG